MSAAASKKVNYVGIVQGYPESGKTTLMAEHVARWVADGGMVVLHDPDAQFCSVATHYPSAAAWMAAFARAAAANQKMPAAVSLGDVSEAEVTAAALLLAQCLRAMGSAVPVLLGYDEAVLLSKTTQHYIDPTLAEILARRRHLGIGLEILCQTAGQLHAQWRQLATDMFMFRWTDSQNLRDLCRQWSLPPSVAEAVPQLPDHHYVHLRPGRVVSHGSP